MQKIMPIGPLYEIMLLLRVLGSFLHSEFHLVTNTKRDHIEWLIFVQPCVVSLVIWGH